MKKTPKTLHEDDIRLEKWLRVEEDRLARKIAAEYAKAAKQVAEKMRNLFERMKKSDKPPAAMNLTKDALETWRAAKHREQLRTSEEAEESSSTLSKAGKYALPLILALCIETSKQNGSPDFRLEPETQRFFDSMTHRRTYADSIQHGFSALLGGATSMRQYAAQLGRLITSHCSRLINAARGAANRAQNWARLQWMRLQNALGGDVWGKLWDAVNDGRTRDSHAAMDGQIRRMNEYFITGAGHLIMYPGDTSAPIQEWINCRCNLRRVRIL